MLVFHYEHLENYIESSKYFTPINNITQNYTRLDIKWDGYCDDLCKFYKGIIKSKRDGYIISDVLDMIPTMVKCKNIRKWLYNNKYIKSINNNLNLLTIEVNHILFTKIILLKRKVRNKIIEYIKPYQNECKIGLQYRDNDGCVIWNRCSIDNKTVNNILSHISKFNGNRKCWLFISTANKLLINELKLRYNKTVLFLPNERATHSSVYFNNGTYEKTIGDMIFPSLTDYLIITYHSTYSKLILYQFYKSKMRNIIFNNFIFIKQNGELNENEPYTELIDNIKTKNCIPFPHL